MAVVWRVCFLLLLLATVCAFAKSSGGPPNLAGEDYVYTLKGQDGSLCLYASFNLTFTIHYINDSMNITSESFQLPPSKEVSIGGQCSNATGNNTKISTAKLVLNWTNHTDFSTSLNFVKNESSDMWYLSQCNFTFSFNNSKFVNPEEFGKMTYWTNPNATMFNRSFSLSNYFYCKSERTYNFDGACFNNGSSCSSVLLQKAVMYMGNITEDKASRRLCEEDYVLEQEKLVPIIVGAILAFLLLAIFVSYVISYVYRKRKERSIRGYDPVSVDE